MDESGAADHQQIPMERVPETHEWYKEQIAGHHQSIIKNGERQIGFLKEKRGDLILKLVQEGVRGECEVQVYTRLAELRNQSTVEDGGDGDQEKDDVVVNENKIIIQQLASFVPTYHGLTKVALGNKEREFMKLEDLTVRFRCPCIMDIKMGKVTFDPLATAEKSAREMSKYPEQQKLGFRILGYRLHKSNDDVMIADKKWGLSWKFENIDDAFNDYMQLTDDRRTQVLSIFKDRLREIHEWFSRQRIYHFYASSLLFIYDSDPTEEGLLADVRMIDFSHTFPACKSTDQNYLFGLNRICEIFDRL
uniref:Kinase n=1 Tax=Steinernema glaseri TaxID=37863 RepID=A0A1I8A1B3_9BILA